MTLNNIAPILKRLCISIGTKHNTYYGGALLCRYSSRHVRRRTSATQPDENINVADDCNNDKKEPSILDLRAQHFRKSLIMSKFVNNVEENEKIFRKIVVSLGMRKFREKKGKILLEGKNLIEVAMKLECFPETIFYSKESSVPSLDGYEQNIDIRKVPSRAFRLISGNIEPPTVVAVCKKPVSVNLLSKSVLPVTILCSNVRDPENMGSIINIAANAGCKSVLLTKGCVDSWERKVLKASEGAHFFVPITSNVEWYDIGNYIPKNACVYIADSSSDIRLDDSQIYSETDYQTSSGHFANDEIDVAYRNAGNFSSSRVIEYEEIDVAYRNDGNSSSSNRVIKHDPEEVQLMQVEDDEEFPCMLYSNVSFPKKDIVVYVGGETEGVDPRARELVRDYEGMGLKIPLENDMDSLNVCSALSVIVYEIKRQLGKKLTKNAKN